MPLFVDQTIYCSGCGRPYKARFSMGWISRAATARVCGRDCADKLDAAYTRYVMGEPDPADAPVVARRAEKEEPT